MLLCAALIVAMLAYQASAGCGRWVIRENTDYLQDPIFDEAVASSTGPSSTVKPGNTSSQTGDRLQGYASSKEKTDPDFVHGNGLVSTGWIWHWSTALWTGDTSFTRATSSWRRAGLAASQINFLNVIYGTARGALS